MKFNKIETNKRSLNYLEDNGLWKPNDMLNIDLSDKKLPCILYGRHEETGRADYMVYVKEDEFTVSSLYTEIAKIDEEELDKPIGLYKFILKDGKNAYESVQGILEDGTILLSLEVEDEVVIEWTDDEMKALLCVRVST